RRHRQQQQQQQVHQPQQQPRRGYLSRRRAESLNVTEISQNQYQLIHQQESNDNSGNMSTDTLVNEGYQRIRAFSDPALSEHAQHEYSYYPWTESEDDEIRSRSPPPPTRPHYETFPSLVEMGGFLSI
ncbi:hypothetical protein EV175_002392, partial [Coemansia sp. RSA 1933]